jgi:hypothetical protein
MLAVGLLQRRLTAKGMRCNRDSAVNKEFIEYYWLIIVGRSSSLIREIPWQGPSDRAAVAPNKYTIWMWDHLYR